MSLLSYLSNPHEDNQYGQMYPFEQQSHVNKLFKKELIVAILWNARRSTESPRSSQFTSLREILREQSGISRQIRIEVRKNFGLA